MFQSSFSNPKLGIYSTRLYFLLLVITGVILALYSFFTLHLVTVNIQQPTQDQFEKLHLHYSSSLVCPCSHLSIPYNKIITTGPLYHQICSSDFIRHDRWLSYFTFIKSSLASRIPYFAQFDFRTGTGFSMFFLLRILCITAQDTVNNARKQFNTTKLVSSHAMSRDMFEQKTNAIIEQFQDDIQTSFHTLFSHLRAAMEDNQLFDLYTSKGETATLVNPNRVRLIYRFSWNATCSCAFTDKCMSPMSFYTYTLPVWSTLRVKSIPGLFVGCSVLDSLLLSTPECLYDRLCIQMLKDYRDVGIKNQILPADSGVNQTTPLNSRLSSRYLPNSTFEEIISNMFIEKWISSISFNNYFNYCQPIECTYIFPKKYRPIAVLTTLLGVMSGLTVVLQLIIPICVRSIKSIVECCSGDRTTTNRITTYFKYIRRKASTLNVYLERSSTNESNDHGILATRFYLVFLFIIFSVILIFASFSEQTHSITIHSPSEQTFSKIYDLHNATLSCSCTKALIPYGSFLSITAKFHQVCSSNFVTSEWWKYLWNINIVWDFEDARLLSSHFRILESLCSLAQQSINDTTRMLNNSDMLSIDVLPRNSFQIHVYSIINSSIVRTIDNFRRLQSFITDAIRFNQFINVAETTWTLAFSNEPGNIMLETIPVSSYRNNCICAASLESCSRLLYMNRDSSEVTLPGLVAGCLPINGLRLSTLECFFNSSCLHELSEALSVRPTAINYNPQPLNASLPSIFKPTTPLSTLMDALFVEEWINSSNYSNYFSSCAPYSCSYTYVQRNDILYMITTILGIYGGLTLVLHFVVWHGLRFIRINIIATFIRCHNATVHPTPGGITTESTQQT